MKRIYRVLNVFNFALFLTIIGLSIFILSIIWLIFINQSITSELSPIDYELASKFGSYIGGIVGSIWTGAGVFFIYATFKKQKEFNEKQAFEQSFQNLMNSYHTIINNTKGTIIIFDDYDRQGRTIECNGRDYFSSFLLKFKKTIWDKSFIDMILKKKNIPEVLEFKGKERPGIDSLESSFTIRLFLDTISSRICPVKEQCLSIELINEMYEYCYEKHQNSLGHYFRFIYNIFKFIIENKKSEEERLKYIGLIQAHMSNDELGIVFYNGLSKYSKNKEGISQFKKWMETYNFFENMDKSCLLCSKDSKHYKTEYKHFTK